MRRLYRFRGIANTKDDIYSPAQLKALKLAKDSQFEKVSTRLSRGELHRMKEFLNLPYPTVDNDTILKEFIYRTLNGESRF